MRATLVAAFLSFAIIAATCTKKPTEPPNGNGGPDTTSHNWTFTTYTYHHACPKKGTIVTDPSDKIWRFSYA